MRTLTRQLIVTATVVTLSACAVTIYPTQAPAQPARPIPLVPESPAAWSRLPRWCSALLDRWVHSGVDAPPSLDCDHLPQYLSWRQWKPVLAACPGADAHAVCQLDKQVAAATAHCWSAACMYAAEARGWRPPPGAKDATPAYELGLARDLLCQRLALCGANPPRLICPDGSIVACPTNAFFGCATQARPVCP